MANAAFTSCERCEMSRSVVMATMPTAACNKINSKGSGAINDAKKMVI